MIFNHSINRNLAGVWDHNPLNFNPSLIKRICQSYQSNYLYETDRDIWTDITINHQNIIDLILNNEYEQIHNYLSHLFDSSLMHGIAQGDWCSNIFKDNEEARYINLTMVYDRLLSLCEYLGVIPIDNPEQGVFDYNIPPKELLTRIYDKIGYFKLPGWQGGAWMIDSGIGSIFDKDVQSIYIADKVSKMFPAKDISICEIGGGAGHLAYYLNQFGFKDVTIVDLPNIAIGQAFFLNTNTDDDGTVSLMGECDSEINLRCPDYFGKRKYDLVINVDSLPEMGNKVALDYLQKISKSCKLFYSINQEAFGIRTDGNDSQIPVSVNINTCKNMKLVSRNKFWIRKGYAEEVMQKRFINQNEIQRIHK
jgi:hypothetical protein